MKKIFAIALALVMVFSMASAFALNDCFSGFDWTCPTTNTDCGKAKVEVVPYVKVNNGCGGFDWQVNDCATAIVSENVYFAVVLTVDAFVDDAWWDAPAAVTVDVEGLVEEDTTTPFEVEADALDTIDGFEYDDDEEQVFYLGTNGAWVAEDNVVLNNVIFAAEVADADEAEVCATIASAHDGYDVVWEYAGYEVLVERETASATDAGTLTITEGNSDMFTMTWFDGEVTAVGATSAAFMSEVMVKFNLAGCAVGTCVDDTIVQRNFGWDDEFENCFAWSNKGAAVVNPECVVAIPKTGDVSVVAYAVMAVVAAAGAMLKK